jgi:hypothetical protein
MLLSMSLEVELGEAVEAAQAFSAPGETLAGIVAAEPDLGVRVYVCAFENGGETSWLALDGAGRPVLDAQLIRDAVAIAALCELAEECAGGGRIEELQGRLAELRAAEAPEGIEEAELAAAELARTLGEPPRLASPTYLDAVGGAVARLERALGGSVSSPFAEAMRSGTGAVEELVQDVERTYKRPLG